MTKAKVLIFSGYGLNCEMETMIAFNSVGLEADVVHLSDVLSGEVELKDYQVLCFPGGFSYGDDTGSGNAYSISVRDSLEDGILSFAEKGLIIGICNGCQIIARLFPEVGISLLRNGGNGTYVCRWADVKAEEKNNSPWLLQLRGQYSSGRLPIAHGEGKFYFDEASLGGTVALRYEDGSNFNGSVGNVAAVTGKNGRLLCMMPHPERAFFLHQSDNWPALKEEFKRGEFSEEKYGWGYRFFSAAAEYLA
jgi:phosphoribosylformylglycinamidine synthase